MWYTWPKIWGRLSKILGSGGYFKVPSPKMAKNSKITPFLTPTYATLHHHRIKKMYRAKLHQCGILGPKFGGD